ncbi:selenium-dependent molybdenum cofactor biosynthesis protein YqeB [Clostridium sp. DJ247]|uniref:selenium-dependent molybdenum cofactor biosynthesis protein YqeB n=1 Tax=Clostridium sp. DJ247 TaxID=2726188 RepID=UPI001626A17F|nr:selenium-dependent molybdenum cofactor biosynthesis protein YqeB [Clostridium sp. DJ247]MBC2581807.1 EF2563 family selenium-dependent molybdenum hydroxylase system protein [Clostridium sp. DJ247]
MFNDIAIVRGGGDIASGTIQKLHRSGFKVLVLEISNPTSIRRNVCYSEAIYEGETTIEGITSTLVNSITEIEIAWSENKIPVVIDPEGYYINIIKPEILIDAVLAKKNLGTKITMANITIAVGPGFEAGKDVHIVIETMRGHNLGKLIFEGSAMKDTGVPGDIKGFSKERVIYSPSNGIIENVKNIGDVVRAGEVIAYVNNNEVLATIDGLLRGIIRNGSTVWYGLKIADIDPRISELKNCYTISDKARSIAGGVLEAVLYLKNK